MYNKSTNYEIIRNEYICYFLFRTLARINTVLQKRTFSRLKVLIRS